MKPAGERAQRARFTVRLVYDSLLLQESFGRRCAPDEDRSLLFRAGPLSLDVLLYGTLEGIHGQLRDEASGRPVAGAAVCVGQHDAKTDSHGHFSLPPADAARLVVRAGGLEIAFPLPTHRLAVAG